ncbi:hypothetical protein JCM10908_001259 [Rhodotorula pacifica]|uniref:uncharacterized protein n=1 Tax=Rhodotorula pacifica TaxID=1495444 RepID=UPI00316E12AC
MSVGELRKLKRAQLQSLAKEHGIKANLKTEALIEALSSALQSGSPSLSASDHVSRSGPANTVQLGRQVTSDCATASQDCIQLNSTDLSAKVDDLTALVKTLQGELREARQTIASTRELLEAQQAIPAPVSLAEIKALVHAEFAAQINVHAAELQRHKDDVDAEFRTPRSEALDRHALVQVEEHSSRLEDAGLPTPQAAQANELALLQERIERLESRARQLGSDVVEKSGGGGQANSPTYSDAPPTRTLISFSSPATASPRPSTTAGSRHSALKPPHQPGTPGPLALPTHMATAAASAVRRTPRAAILAIQPESPVPLPSNASLGKHKRCSDASEFSIDVGAVAVDASVVGTPTRSESGFHTAPSSIARVAPTSADNHMRKRLRISALPSEDAAENAQEAAEDSDDDDDEVSRENNTEVREYTVRTKSGSSPVVATSTRRSSITRDPSFFASRPVSPSSRPAARSRSRASSVASNFDENSEPGEASAGRKSLPLSTLPFPLISPYRASTATKSAVPTPKAQKSAQRPALLFGTAGAGTPSSGKTGFGNFFSGLDSVNRGEASRRTSLFSTTNASARKSNLPPPPTPPASRTLFGTEFAGNRFGDAGADADEEVDEDTPRLRWGAFAA